MLDRPLLQHALKDALRRSPIAALVGPRQVGKTTLARRYAEALGGAVFLDLESPRDRARLADPMGALEALSGLVVLDEVQYVPDLFPALRVLVDADPGRRFLLLGSASPELLRQGAETLAGRIAWIEVPPLTLAEVGTDAVDPWWVRGGFPRSFLADSDADSVAWREDFVRAFVERDLQALGPNLPPVALRRFWTMLAHNHGQTWNGADFGRAFGVSDHTVRRWLDVMSGALVLRQLAPWHANIAKRQVKAPKVYVCDSGLVHHLLGLRTYEEVLGHPVCGATWEGAAISSVIDRLGARWADCYFWRTHAGAELDLLVMRGDTRVGFEVKRNSAPRVTPSMRHALADLDLAHLWVVHGGRDTYALGPSITAVPLLDLSPIST